MDAKKSLARLKEAITNLRRVSITSKDLKDPKIVGLLNHAAESVEQLVHYIKSKGVR
jgi:hypothetical protein